MKAVLDLTKAITDSDYYDEQFSNGGKEKNILFLEPQLTSKHLYKFILPFFSFYNEKVYTAISNLSKYNPFVQIANFDTKISANEILWADYIVFPFTTTDLTKTNGLYEAIREVNPNCKIVFCVDFNYYNLPIDHPHKSLFEFDVSINNLEMNILMSDLTLTSNMAFLDFLIKKFNELVENKYKEVNDFRVSFGCVPYLIDEEIVCQNVEFESFTPAPIINKDIFLKVAEIAEEIKKEDLKNNKEKAKKLSNKKQAIRKTSVKTKKVTSKSKSKKQDDTQKTKEKEISQGNEVVENKPKDLPQKIRMGIICSPSNHHDIKFYNSEFQKINELYGDNVTLIFLGYDYEDDKDKILDGVNFEYVKEVSIIHYFKQLQSLNLDLVFVPLNRTLFNVTSENINKYLECGIFNIPIISEDLFPYSQLITHTRNGYLYKGKENFIAELEKTINNPAMLKLVGAEAKRDVIKNYSFNEGNINIISSIYQ